MFVQLDTKYHKQMGELGLVASQVYVYLGCRIKGDGLPWPSPEIISEKLRISLAEVETALKRLDELGYTKDHQLIAGHFLREDELPEGAL